MKRKLVNYRQGDVLIFGVKKAKNQYADYLLRNSNIIIEGELSGHKHEVENGKLYEKDGKLIIEAGAECIVKHPEHAPIKLPQGIYEIDIQEEYDEQKHSAKVKD